MSDPVQVLIADDHARTRALVKTALERSGEFVVCAEAANCDAAVDAAKATRPAVCLLDINMPGSGIAAAQRITASLPGTAVVMLTVSRQDEDLFDALRAGATGYLLKGMDEDSLSTALRQVLNGETPLPPSLVTRLVEEFRDREDRRVAVPGKAAARLTGREWDVLELMRAGGDHRRDRGEVVHLDHHRAVARQRGAAQAGGGRPGGGDRPSGALDFSRRGVIRGGPLRPGTAPGPAW